MKIQTLIRLALIVGLILAISYFFGVSFYFSAIAVSALVLFGEIVNMPESLPGNKDDIEEKSLHPAITITLTGLVLITLITLGQVLPKVYSYGF